MSTHNICFLELEKYVDTSSYLDLCSWSDFSMGMYQSMFSYDSDCLFVCLCRGFTAQSTQWGHVEHGQFT